MNWWSGNSPDVGWTNGNDALFAGSSSGNIVLTYRTATAGNLTFFDERGYTLSGGALTLSGGTITANQNVTIQSDLVGSAGLYKAGNEHYYDAHRVRHLHRRHDDQQRHAANRPRHYRRLGLESTARATYTSAPPVRWFFNNSAGATTFANSV